MVELQGYLLAHGDRWPRVLVAWADLDLNDPSWMPLYDRREHRVLEWRLDYPGGWDQGWGWFTMPEWMADSDYRWSRRARILSLRQRMIKTAQEIARENAQKLRRQEEAIAAMKKKPLPAQGDLF